MTKKELLLSEIVTNAGTQVRVNLNKTTVTDYAEAMAAGAKFPPIIVFDDGSRHLAADGFHRIHAALKTGATKIECEVLQGSKADALKFALGRNVDHGLRRTNADKRHAVGIALKEFPKASLPVISKMCMVSEELVKCVSKQLTENGGLRPTETVIGLDGRERKLPSPPIEPRPGITAASEPEAAPGMMLSSTADRLPAVLLPPPPSEILDETGAPIPTQLIPLWQRADEVQEMLTMLSGVKGALRRAQDNKDKLFAEVNFSSVLSHLDQALADIKTAKPFAVCPTCQGQLPDKCTLCKGRGLISEHRWNTCVSREDKEFRFKAKAKTESRKEQP